MTEQEPQEVEVQAEGEDTQEESSTQQSGTSSRIAQSKVVAQYGSVSARVTEDKLTAYLICGEEPEEPLVPDIIHELLEEGRITHGLQLDKMEAFCEDPVGNSPWVVARGTPPKQGRDGYVEPLIDMDKKKSQPQEDDLENVNYKDLDLIVLVDEGQNLAKLHAPVPGTPGVAVDGASIPPRPVKAVRMPAGKNTKAAGDGDVLVSTIEGSILRRDNRFNVTQTYVISHDVDYHTGNINFNGTVIVNGSILTGFSIKATVGIVVHGIVEGALLESGGDIEITKGVQGVEKAVLKAKGHIRAGFINNAKLIETNKNLIVQGSCIQSFVRAHGKMLCESGRSTISGGHIWAEEGIETSVLGSELGVVTEVEVGGTGQEKNERAQLAKDIHENMQRLDKLNRARFQLDLPADHPMRLETERAINTVNMTIKRDQLLMNALDARIEVLKDSRVKVRHTVFPGVKIRFPDGVYHVQDAMAGVIFAPYQDGIETLPY